MAVIFASVPDDRFISGLLGLRAMIMAAMLGSTATVGALVKGRVGLGLFCAVASGCLVALGVWSLRRSRGGHSPRS